ncbi:MAG: VOC family protein [Novosphingobium sp.]
MPAQLNHTIVWCSDQRSASAFFAEMLSLPEPVMFSHFHVVQMENGVSLDFADKEGRIAPQHYAFLVSDAEFDAGMAKIATKRLNFWADPARTKPGEINRHWGGRGVYFEGPDGHFLELITRPYGSMEDI